LPHHPIIGPLVRNQNPSSGPRIGSSIAQNWSGSNIREGRGLSNGLQKKTFRQIHGI
jgi:hypothetical protein